MVASSSRSIKVANLHRSSSRSEFLLVAKTWSLTEPHGNIQDFTWTPTVNRFQAVLGKDGSVEMSYNEMAAKDAIVGLYPLVTGGKPAKEPEVHLSALTEADGPFQWCTNRFIICGYQRCEI